MALTKTTFAVAVMICIALESTMAVKRHEHDHHQEMKKRSTTQTQEPKKEPSPQPKDDWKPATGPREFSVNVADKITGANQYRQEKWNNNTVTGSYAAPGRNGKWLKYEYVGDANGFRITSTKEVTAEQLMDGKPEAKDHQANVNIKSDQGTAVQYTVTEEQLKSNDKQVHDTDKKQ